MTGKVGSDFEFNDLGVMFDVALHNSVAFSSVFKTGDLSDEFSNGFSVIILLCPSCVKKAYHVCPHS